MKKFTVSAIAAFICVLMLLSIPTAVMAVPEDYYYKRSDYYTPVGDVNMDYIMNAADARRILRVAAKLDYFVAQPEWVGKGETLGDINGDGKITPRDARTVLRIAARLETVNDIIKVTPTKPQNPLAPTNPSVKYETYASYYVKAKVTVGTAKYGIECASDGKDYYAYSENDAIVKGYGFIVRQNGAIICVNDEAKSYVALPTDKLPAGSLQVPALDLRIFNFDDIDKLKTETKTIGGKKYTVVDFKVAKYYLDETETLVKVENLSADGKTVIATIEIEKFSVSSTLIAERLSVPADYKEAELVDFLKAALGDKVKLPGDFSIDSIKDLFKNFDISSLKSLFSK